MQKFFICITGTAENYCIGVFNLVIIKLAKIFHIHAAFAHIRYGNQSIDLYICIHILDSVDHI